MKAFLYQYIVMWVIFLWGIRVGLTNGELALEGPKRTRLVSLVLGMFAMMLLQGAFTDWSAP
jgi:hypothetical protein